MVLVRMLNCMEMDVRVQNRTLNPCATKFECKIKMLWKIKPQCKRMRMQTIILQSIIESHKVEYFDDNKTV